jgi:hypothetical protein
MKQYRISVNDVPQDSGDDAYLAPEDPIHALKAVSIMGGLGGQQRLAEYNATLKPVVVGSNKGQIQREQNIKPGTEAWFKLWFGENNK